MIEQHFADGSPCPFCPALWSKRERCCKCGRVNYEGSCTLTSEPTPIICPVCDHSFKEPPTKSTTCPRCQTGIPGTQLKRPIYDGGRVYSLSDDTDAFRKACFQE